MLKNLRLRHHLIATLAAASAIALQGCGSDESGLAGYYDVVSHTRNATSCDSPGPEVSSSSTGDRRDQQDNPFPDYVRLDDVPFAGQTALRARGCASISDNACTQLVSFELALGVGPIGDGWGSDAVGGPMGDKAACSFSYSGTRIRAIDDQTVEIRMEQRAGSRAVKACDLDHDLYLEGRSLPCHSLETITLRKR